MFVPITFLVKLYCDRRKVTAYIFRSFSERMSFVRQYCGVNRKNISSQTLNFWSVKGLFLFLKTSIQSL